MAVHDDTSEGSVKGPSEEPKVLVSGSSSVLEFIYSSYYSMQFQLRGVGEDKGFPERHDLNCSSSTRWRPDLHESQPAAALAQ